MTRASAAWPPSHSPEAAVWRLPMFRPRRQDELFPRPPVGLLPSPNDPGRLVHADVAKRLGVKPEALAGLMEEGLLARPVTGTTVASK